MARLSNLLRSRDPSDESPIECRPAARHEIEQGLRLILSTASGGTSDEAILDFLSFAVHRKIDVNGMWVALHRERVVWALLPMVSPGQTVLLLTPSRLFRQTPHGAIGLLAEHVCGHFGNQSLRLAQVLLDPRGLELRDLYVQSGFEPLAELLYLHRSVLPAPSQPAVPDGFVLTTYDAPLAHARFARAIERSYCGSLDCPALNGKRRIEEVIAGHKAAGTFEPSMWFLLSAHHATTEAEHGVLLLNSSTHPGTAELIYLGLTPEARGRGLGDFLMRTALTTTGDGDFTELSLAVDSQNTPALSLYYRHGMKRVGRRLALIRELVSTNVCQAPVVPDQY